MILHNIERSGYPIGCIILGQITVFIHMK